MYRSAAASSSVIVSKAFGQAVVGIWPQPVHKTGRRTTSAPRPALRTTSATRSASAGGKVIVRVTSSPGKSAASPGSAAECGPSATTS